MDTPQFDQVVYHATRVTEIRVLNAEYRKLLAVVEYTFYREMTACCTDKFLPYNVASRCRWNLGARWDVPRVVATEVPIIDMSPPRTTREKLREEKTQKKRKTKRGRRQRRLHSRAEEAGPREEDVVGTQVARAQLDQDSALPQ